MVTRPKAQLISYHHFVEKKIFHCSLLPTELSMIPLHSVQSSWPLSKPHVYCDLSMAPKAIQEEKDKISLQNSFSSAFGISVPAPCYRLSTTKATFKSIANTESQTSRLLFLLQPAWTKLFTSPIQMTSTRASERSQYFYSWPEWSVFDTALRMVF